MGEETMTILTKMKFLGNNLLYPMGGAPSKSNKPIFSSQIFEIGSMKGNMLDKVRRNNAVVIQTKFVAGVGGI